MATPEFQENKAGVDLFQEWLNFHPPHPPFCNLLWGTERAVGKVCH